VQIGLELLIYEVSQLSSVEAFDGGPRAETLRNGAVRTNNVDEVYAVGS
jgi:hypothetical protein